MKQSEIKAGKMYSDGKTARTVFSVWGGAWITKEEIGYVTSRDNFREEKHCSLDRFARWAKYPCTVSVEVD